MPQVDLSYEARFTAEHHPPQGEKHPNEFRLVVTVSGPVVNGMVMHFDDLAATVQMLLRSIECVPLTEALPNGSSIEQVSVWIWGQLAPKLTGLKSVTLYDGPFSATHWGQV